MKFGRLGPIAVHLPETVEDNDLYAAEFPKWNMEMIYAKTGVRARHIARPEECVSDLAVAAAEKLFTEYNIDRSSVDFVLLCTQTPDYPLPTTACLVQDRLQLSKSVGALDFNLGCSGFVYGLALAEGLIRSEAAQRVLLITSETYSKYIDGGDRSLRTIFGDGAAAALIDAANSPSLGTFAFGTDGSGGDTLMVASGGARPEGTGLHPRKRQRWGSRLYMDGPEIVKFTIDVVPKLMERLLSQAGWTRDDVQFYLLHQATSYLLEQLRAQLNITLEQAPLALADYGNTVSSTIPILIRDLRDAGRLKPGARSLMVGFGVGLPR